MSRVRMDVPFSMIPEWIVKSEMTSHAKVLYAALARFANMPNGALPGRKLLAEEWLHVSLDTLDRAQKELLEAGAISKSTRAGHTSLYTLHSIPNSRTRAATAKVANSRTRAQMGSRTGAAQKREIESESSLREGESTSGAKPRDEVWDALTDHFGEAGTHGAKSLRGKVVKSLKEAGATADEVKVRIKRYPIVMPPGTLLTETALEKHWPILSGPRLKSPPCEECGMGGGLHVADCSRAAA